MGGSEGEGGEQVGCTHIDADADWLLLLLHLRSLLSQLCFPPLCLLLALLAHTLALLLLVLSVSPPSAASLLLWLLPIMPPLLLSSPTWLRLQLLLTHHPP